MGKHSGCTYCQRSSLCRANQAQALEQGYDIIKVENSPSLHLGKHKPGAILDGFEAIFDAKYGEWLGCHMIGAGVTDMIAEAVLGRKLETTGHSVIGITQ